MTPSIAAAPVSERATLTSDPAAQAYLLLRVAFTVAPILFGLDKFAGVLTDDWTRYGDIALRDFGLLVGALALSRLASARSKGAGTSTGR